MDVRTDSRNGTPVASPGDTIGAFRVQTHDCLDNWVQQLRDNPGCFADMEQRIDQHYRQGAGQLVASLLAGPRPCEEKRRGPAGRPIRTARLAS